VKHLQYSSYGKEGSSVRTVSLEVL
jgi:hypothetical protein